MKKYSKPIVQKDEAMAINESIFLYGSSWRNSPCYFPAPPRVEQCFAEFGGENPHLRIVVHIEGEHDSTEVPAQYYPGHYNNNQMLIFSLGAALPRNTYVEINNNQAEIGYDRKKIRGLMGYNIANPQGEMEGTSGVFIDIYGLSQAELNAYHNKPSACPYIGTSFSIDINDTGYTYYGS